MRLISICLLVAVLAGCTANLKRLDTGETLLGERLAVDLRDPWTQVNVIGQPPRWTIEGLPLDMLLVYPGVKDGAAIYKAPAGSEAKVVSFRASMQPEEIIAMFEAALSAGGSTFTLTKLEPKTFIGRKGLRFEFGFLRRSDNMRLSGVGFAAVDNAELFAMLYIAPRLEFFGRHQAKVEQTAGSAKLWARSATLAQETAKPAQPQQERPCITTMECRARGEVYTR